MYVNFFPLVCTKNRVFAQKLTDGVLEPLDYASYFELVFGFFHKSPGGIGGL